jgi:hypothetical protein
MLENPAPLAFSPIFRKIMRFKTPAFLSARAMSYMVWKIMRILPKPLLLVLLFFLLAARA